MRRIRLNVDHLKLNGFDPAEARALAQALEAQLPHVLASLTGQGEWARPHRTPVLKLGRMPLNPGTAGAGELGKQVANAVGRGLMR
jgi:hypothetical protein